MSSRDRVQLQSTLRNRTVGITGAAGALAHYLIEALVQKGVAKIVLFDNRTPDLPTKWSGFSSKLIVITGDILSLDDLQRSVDGCEFVFHLAARTPVACSGFNPVEYFRVNTLGTVNVLEACRLNSVQGFLYTSTIHVYGSPLETPVREGHPLRPLSAYATSKLAGEIAVQGYRVGFGMNTMVARISNVYGARISADTVVGRALDQVRRRAPIALRSFAPIRDFIHAGDVAEALVSLASMEVSVAGSAVFNVSSGQGTSIGEMAHILDRVARTMGFGGKGCMETGGDDPIPIMVADPSLLRRATGWSPRYDLYTGLGQSLRDLLAKGTTDNE